MSGTRHRLDRWPYITAQPSAYIGDENASFALPPSSQWKGARGEHTATFQTAFILTERLVQEAARFRAQSEQLPYGPERDKLMPKARQLETATHVDEWLSSPGLQAPL